MSSAAGLSAAKRRRGASSSTNTSNTTRNAATTNVQSQVQKSTNSGAVPGKMPPIPQVLYVHEERLRHLEKLVGDDAKSVNENTVDKSEFIKVVQAMHTDMKNLNQKLMDLQSAVLSNSSAIKTQVEKEVVEEIVEQTADLSVSSESSDDQDSKPSDDQ